MPAIQQLFSFIFRSQNLTLKNVEGCGLEPLHQNQPYTYSAQHKLTDSIFVYSSTLYQLFWLLAVIYDFMNDEMERTWKEALVDFRRKNLGICQEEQRKTKHSSSQDSRPSGRN
jgi:hypothetical protein